MPQAIMVATRNRALFAGVVGDSQDKSETTMTMQQCRMIGSWGIEKDVNVLATVGPDPDSQVTVPATITVQGIIAVWDLEPAAWTAWQAGVWEP